MGARNVVNFQRTKYARVSKSVLNNEEDSLKPVDIAVYTVLCMYADNSTKKSYPKLATIAKKARCSERAVSRSIKVLKEEGYVEVRKRADGRGLRTSNEYVLLDFYS